VEDGDLEAARRYLRDASRGELETFARRQLGARLRLGRLLDFYRVNPCRMARIHALTALAVTVGRFCGYSPSFDAIGEAVMPIATSGEPRTEDWLEYRTACAARRPLELRDELWMKAHVRDMEAVRAKGLDREFEREVGEHRDDPTWALLRQHMEMTLGARLLDRTALSGAIPYETAMAEGMSTAVGRILRAGSRLIHRYASEATRALFLPDRETREGLLSYRRAALLLLFHSFYAWTASPVYRRGIRLRDRGRTAEDDAWSLLSEVLAKDQIEKVHPRIVRFYENPSRFEVRASLELNTVPARFWSWAVTFLVGQGLYESHLGEFDAKFRVYRREDGSMHFVRELYLGDKLRVFDSDFVVRTWKGRPTLFEVFVDHGIEVRMAVEALADGRLLIRGERIRVRGLGIPRLGIAVEFTSRPAEGAGGDELAIDGLLLMKPASRLGRLIAHRVLRRPEKLGAIHYRIRPR
jgi:hypothetical protein